jgi:GNAT superfamily N-acetyltransferase
VSIRAATAADETAIAAVATAHHISGRDSVHNPRYQALLRDRGRLIVADDGGEVIGFGGMIPAAGVAMITDLFVLESHHGQGFGTRITDALLDGYERRMTFSSAHPAARAAYVRAGMTPRWTLRYLRGRANPPPSPSLQGVEVSRAAVQSDRPELVELFDWGRCFHIVDRAGLIVGHAIVTQVDSRLAIERLNTTANHAAAMAALLGALTPNADVSACVPSESNAVPLLERIGFEQTETDLHLSSEPDLMPPTLAAVNPGLA